MLPNRKAIVLTLAALLAAGCARSDFRFSPHQQQMRPAVDGAAALNASEAEPPGILPETHYAAARLFESQGLTGRAIAQYRKAIAVNHSYAQAYHRLALLLSRAGAHEGALQAFDRALQLRPDDAILRNNVGFELLLAKRWTDAERELCRAIELKPDFARAHVNLGMVQSRLGRFNEALASFQAVLPEADAYYNLGLMRRGQQLYEEAADAFQQVLSINPDFSAARTQLEQIASYLKPKTPPTTQAQAVQLMPTVVEAEPTADATESTTTGPEATPESGPPCDDLVTMRRVLIELGPFAPVGDESGSFFGPPRADERSNQKGWTPHTRTSRPHIHETVPEQTAVDSDGKRPDIAKVTWVIGDLWDSTKQAAVPEEATNARQVRADGTAVDWARPHVLLWDRLSPDVGRQSNDRLESLSHGLESLSHGEARREPSMAPAVTPAEAATNPTDAWAALQELEDRLAIVRNEITCLESLNAELEASRLVRPDFTMELYELTGPPADTPEQAPGWHPVKARLVADEETAGPNEAANTREPATDVDIEGPADATPADETHKPNADTPTEERAPTDRSSSWRAAFEKPEELLAIALNEIACWKAARTASLRDRFPRLSF